MKNKKSLETCPHGFIDRTCTRCHGWPSVAIPDDIKIKPPHTPTPDLVGLIQKIWLPSWASKEDRAYMARAVKCHEELLQAAKWIVVSFRPDERPQGIEELISKAEGRS